MSLPPATPKPCDECPFRSTSLPGWLGPHSAEEWAMMVDGEAPIACHQTVKDTDDDGAGSWDHPTIKQCRGAAILRANICKSPRNPDIVTGPRGEGDVFKGGGWPLEAFLEHHGSSQEAYRNARLAALKMGVLP